MKLSDEYAFLTTNLQTLAPLEIGMAEEFRMSSSPLNSTTLCNLPVLLFRYTRTSKNQYRFLHGLNTRICTNHQLIVSPLHNRALRMFDYTSYFVTIGLSNTVQLRGKLFSDVGTPRVSFVLPSSALLSSFFPPVSLLISSFLSRCNKDVLFNLRVSSLTERGLYQDASDFWKL